MIKDGYKIVRTEQIHIRDGKNLEVSTLKFNGGYHLWVIVSQSVFIFSLHC